MSEGCSAWSSFDSVDKSDSGLLSRSNKIVPSIWAGLVAIRVTRACISLRFDGDDIPYLSYWRLRNKERCFSNSDST